MICVTVGPRCLTTSRTNAMNGSKLCSDSTVKSSHTPSYNRMTTITPVKENRTNSSASCLVKTPTSSNHFTRYFCLSLVVHK